MAEQKTRFSDGATSLMQFLKDAIAMPEVALAAADSGSAQPLEPSHSLSTRENQEVGLIPESRGLKLVWATTDSSDEPPVKASLLFPEGKVVDLRVAADSGEQTREWVLGEAPGADCLGFVLQFSDEGVSSWEIRL